MDRRGFFGAVLGLVAETQIPFLAKEAEPAKKYPKLERAKKLLELFDKNLYQGEMDLITDDGIIKGPRIELCSKDMEALKIEIKCQSILMTSVLNVKGLIYTIDGFSLEKMFTYPICVVPGDSLNITYNFEATCS